MAENLNDFKDQINRKLNDIDEIRSMMSSESNANDTPEKETLLRNISQAFIEKTSEEEERKVLSDFVNLKSSGKTDNYLKAINQFGPETLGKENWLIGLVGMLYDKNMTDPTVMDALVTRLIEHLDDRDIFFVRSIVKGILTRANEIPEKARKRLISYLMHPQYRVFLQKYQGQYVGEELKEMIGTLFDKIANPGQKYKLLEELGRQGVSPKKQLNLTPIKNSAFSNKAKHKIYIDNNDPESSHPIQWKVRRADEASQSEKRTIILAPLAAMGTHAIPNVTLLETSSATLQKEIIESIKRLLHTGYEKIDLILPHHQVFSFTDFATELTQKYGARVEVIDSKTYGLALRRTVEECSRSFINQKPTQDISSLVQKITKNTHYWLMPKTNLGIRKTIWYNNIPSSMSKFELHQIPMIRFEEEGCTTKNKNIFADNIEEVLKDIKNLIASSSQIPREVLIEQTAGTAMDIPNLQAKLQRILPANRIKIVSADPQVAIELRDYIGICLR